MRNQFAVGLFYLSIIGLATITAFGGVGPAVANDSASEMRAGGLVLQRTQAVSMKSEDLFISRTKVKVRYVYRNLTRQPVTLTVTFPLPDRNPIDQGYSVIPRDDGSVDFVGFTTKVDGRSVALTPIVRGILGGRDVTSILRGMNLLVAPDADLASDRISALTTAQKATLKRQGLFDEGLGPRWTLKTDFVRQQIFPVGRDVVVEHEYTPGVGGVPTSFLLVDDIDESTLAGYRRDYCVNDTFRASGNRLKASNEAKVDVLTSEAWLSYVLTTGANWATPIGRFRLVVDKEDPDALVSFCGQNIRKISPTQFEMVRTNWRPDRDLRILFIHAWNRDDEGE